MRQSSDMRGQIRGRPRRACLVAATACLALFGCWCDEPEVTRLQWQILGHRAPVMARGDEPEMALVRLDEDGTEYRIRASRLVGFEAEWGTRYTLAVVSSESPRRIDVSALPSTSFEAIVERTPVAGEAFRVHMIGAPWLADGGRAFVDGQAFSCPTLEVCAALDARRADPGARFDLQMRHGPGGALELLAVEAGTCRYHADCEEPKRSWCCAGRCAEFEDVFVVEAGGDSTMRPECGTPRAARRPVSSR